MVTVVMAVYNPNLLWLEKQLLSIQQQTYSPLELLALDDASDDFTAIEAVFEKCLTTLPYRLHRENINQGSTLCFEKLTEMAEGKYISYCDQDDIWEPDKTEKLVHALEEQNAVLSYSDLSIIDEHGNHAANSLTDVRKRLVHRKGEGLTEELLFRNFTNGTAMLMKTKTAKAAIPFVKEMHADHWLTLWSSTRGAITFVSEPLVRYRLHGSNQSAVLSGVVSRDTYISVRLERMITVFTAFEERFASHAELRKIIADGKEWFQARQAWMNHGDISALRTVFANRKLGKSAAYFEIVTARLPDKIFMWFVGLVRQGKL